MARIRAVLFDAAGTLLVKDRLAETITVVLAQHAVATEALTVAARHRLLSEATDVPDRTTRAFYEVFNANLIRTLGALPNRAVLDDLYEACGGLPWVPAPGADALAGLSLGCGVVSNWDRDLTRRLQLLDRSFDPVVGSAEVGFRKPALEIFRAALGRLGLPPGEVAYVGDSIRLDMEPAVELGMMPILVDDLGLYLAFNGVRIASLAELPEILE